MGTIKTVTTPIGALKDDKPYQPEEESPEISGLMLEDDSPGESSSESSEDEGQPDPLPSKPLEEAADEPSPETDIISKDAQPEDSDSALKEGSY